MRRIFLRALLAGFGLAVPLVASADENKDLDRIPPGIGSDAPAASNKAAASGTAQPHGKHFLEDAFTLFSLRGGLAVPTPPARATQWRNRASLDAADQWHLFDDVSVSLSNRFSLLAENDYAFPSRQVVRNDFREGYVTWQPLAQNYLEAGRINLRNGVALGFNPTDFFKSRSAVDQASSNPSALRDNRLGTLMLRGQSILSAGSVTFAYAPKFYTPTPVAIRPQPGISPMFDRTNAADRFLLSASTEIADLSPEALLYHANGQTRLGLNLTRPIGQSIVAYAEWAGGRRRDLIAEALSYGQKTGTLPASAPVLPPSDTNKSFRNDAALGFSWTSAAKITLNLEYHYHQAGLSGAQQQRWFAVGQAQRGFLPVTSELWYLRAYANDQQEPWSRQQIFLRADWSDAFITNLELTAIGFVNLYDGSSLTQLSAHYFFSRDWTIGAYASANLGGKRSERGSFAQAGSAILQLQRYF
jgi:hypothetical protein